MLTISILLALLVTSSGAQEKQKWPVEINNNEAMDLYHCLYIYFICSDYIGNWPDNKNNCVSYFNTCETLIPSGAVGIAAADNASNTIQAGGSSSSSSSAGGSAGGTTAGGGAGDASSSGTGASSTTTSPAAPSGDTAASPGTTTSAPGTTTTASSGTSTTTPANTLGDTDTPQVPGGVLNVYQEATRPATPIAPGSPPGPFSCKEILTANPNSSSGVYNITVNSNLKEVYCDMVESGGGWTVIQRRGDNGNNESYFYRQYRAYQDGFGDPNLDVWAGLDTMNSLTSPQQGQVQLMIKLSDFDNNMTSLIVNNFTVGNEASGYSISYLNYNSKIGNSLPARGTKFSTIDNDNDLWSLNCAERFSGAWWYTACHNSNINGLYLRGPHLTFGNGVEWYHWKGYYYSLKTTEMKVRAK